MQKIKATVAAVKGRPMVVKFEAKSVSQAEATLKAMGEKVLRLKFWNGQKWQKAY